VAILQAALFFNLFPFMYKKKNIVLYVLVLLVMLGCQQKSVQKTPKNPLLLISFDGFRYDYLSRTDTPNFDSLAAEGVLAEGLISVFPTKTFPNHYSIATGLYPENTGLIANNMYDQKFEEWYRISKREAVENKKWYGGEPVWNTVEKQGLKAGTMFWVGSEAPVQGMRPSYWKKYDGNMADRARIDTVLKWFTYNEDRKINLGTLYFELVDDAGHDYGLESDSLDMAIQKADSLMGYLKKRAVEKELWDKLNIIILSDHGMVNLSADKMILLDDIIDIDHIERMVWAPATMIQPKEDKTDEVYQKLKEAEEKNNYSVYRKEELPDRYRLKNHRRVPAIIMIADLGYTILNKKRKKQFLDRLPTATHGYDNYKKDMQGFFLAGGPDFKENTKVSGFQNIHIYELMNMLLGTTPAPNDGSPDSVNVLLK